MARRDVSREALGDRLRSLRVSAGLSVRDMVQKTGIPRSTIYRWFIGDAVPTIEDMWLLCDVFGVDPNGLLGYTPPEEQFDDERIRDPGSPF